MKKKKILNIFLRILVGILVVVLLVCLPIVGVRVSDDFSHISGKFVGLKSKYQGIIEVWNIDTFESGTNAKSKYISEVAESFQKQNLGLYVLVRDLTEYECINLLEKGEKPDIFSCSYGVANTIKDYIVPFSDQNGIEVDQTIINAGKKDDELYALAWCMGFYTLISSEEHLTKAKVNLEENIILSQKALDLGYEIISKKDSKIISSLTYGVSNYLLPKKAFCSYTNKGLVSTSSYSLDSNVKNQSQYTAYSKFIAGKSVMLLGTQRDVFRMNNRVKNGKSANVLYEPLNSFTDLIQFSFLAKNDDDVKLSICENFAKFLTLRENQKKLINIGMLSVLSNNFIYNSGIMCDIIPQNFSILAVNNIFVEKQELASLQ